MATREKGGTRARLVRAAGSAFRAHGVGGIGVDAIAKDAGVTSGAFYANFSSKGEVFREAVAVGLDQLRGGIAIWRTSHKKRWLSKFAEWYLSAERRADIASSCALPTLSLEVARSDEVTRRAYDAQLLAIVAELEAGLVGSTARKRDDALTILALLSGGMTLAHAVSDQQIGLRIARAVQRAIAAIAERSDSTD